MRIGVLAYGSLIDDPGVELGPLVIGRIDDVVTPFKIEFARFSRTRGNAPTLIPVDAGGAAVKATILVLDESVTEEQAENLVWRRETRKEKTDKKYNRPVDPSPNHVLVEHWVDYPGFDVVLYTKIGSNIDDLSPDTLADLAIESARSEAGQKRLDGISYLIDAKANGITTPLMPAYEESILQKLGAESLEAAWAIARKQGGEGLR